MTTADDDRKGTYDVFEDLIKQARRGDRESADSLLKEFASIAAKPGAFDAVGGVPANLLQYVATCVADWRKRSYRDAETWFNVGRPDHRPARPVTAAHIVAMRVYMVLRARGYGRDGALTGAVAYSKLTEDQVRYVVESHPERDVLIAVVSLLVTRRLRSILKRPPPRKKYQRRV